MTNCGSVQIHLRPPFSETFIGEEADDRFECEGYSREGFYRNLRIGDYTCFSVGAITSSSIKHIIKMLKLLNAAQYVEYTEQNENSGGGGGGFYKLYTQPCWSSSDVTTSNFYDDIEKAKPCEYDCIIITDCDEKAWIVHDIKGLIKELREVVVKCKENSTLLWEDFCCINLRKCIF
jgi:hypothetical protein